MEGVGRSSFSRSDHRTGVEASRALAETTRGWNPNRKKHKYGKSPSPSPSSTESQSSTTSSTSPTSSFKTQPGSVYLALLHNRSNFCILNNSVYRSRRRKTLVPNEAMKIISLLDQEKDKGKEKERAHPKKKKASTQPKRKPPKRQPKRKRPEAIQKPANSKIINKRRRIVVVPTLLSRDDLHLVTLLYNYSICKKISI